MTGQAGKPDVLPPVIFRSMLNQPVTPSEKQQPERRDHRVIVMTRYPEPGKTKTRLIPAVGSERAAAIHLCLVMRTLNVALQAMTTSDVQVEVHYTGGSEDQFRTTFGVQPRYVPQSEGVLGERMQSAMAAAFREGASRVVVIGTDCPALDSSHLAETFEQLARTDVVIGPANDGGYYLIGTRRQLPQLFEDIDWGTDRVLQQTLQQAAELNVTVSQRVPLSDVDFAEDLIQCRRFESDFETALPQVVSGRISIIIPTLNEAITIVAALQRLQGVADVEIIVADGGSDDQTVELARNSGATVISCNRGRGQQMNAGAALASGEILLFLHADTQLPYNFAEDVRHSLKSGVGGAFRLSIDANGWLLRLVEFGANMRSRWLQLPYGDQAIFVPAQLFFQLNGFRHIPLMEDYDFCHRLRRLGKITIAAFPVTTSARRWQKLGVLRTTLTNLACIVAFRIGVSPERLAKWYRLR